MYLHEQVGMSDKAESTEDQTINVDIPNKNYPKKHGPTDVVKAVIAKGSRTSEMNKVPIHRSKAGELLLK